MSVHYHKETYTTVKQAILNNMLSSYDSGKESTSMKEIN
jgi:hypothetical protein